MTSTMGLVIDYAEADANERYFFFNREAPEEFQEAAKNKDIIRAALEQRIKELERDALRYRWLRDSDFERAKVMTYIEGLDEWLGYATPEDIDAQVDRAMSEAALTKMREMAQEYKLP